MFQKAERKKARLRLGICGTSGSGKTYSALLIASGLGKKIAVVDTENHSAELYAGKDGMPEYDVCILAPPYETEKYVKAIEEAEKAGYDVIILDSISHAWAGEGGLLDQQGKIADSGRGNSYTAWRNVTPKHTKFIEKMLSCNLHLIATMRSKTEYALQTNDKGKAEPKKVGMAPIQREGMDYEFTSVLDMDVSHNAMSTKDRTGIFDGKIFRPTADTGKALKSWLEEGTVPEAIQPAQNNTTTKDQPEVEHTPAPAEQTGPDYTPRPDIVARPAPAPAPAPDGIDEAFVKIEKVESKEGTTNGRKWKAYFVKTATGGSYGTFNGELATLATKCAKDGNLVRITHKAGRKAGSRELVSIEAEAA